MTQHVKKLSSPRLQAAVLASSLALTLVGAPAPAPAPAAAAEEAQQVKSVFVDRPNFGRDPFFPTSTRRGRMVETNRVEPVANFNNIVLKGTSGTPEKRLAIINNKTFEVGEEGDLRVGGQPMKVKCVEIREKSIVISLNGVTKELFLDTKF